LTIDYRGKKMKVPRKVPKIEYKKILYTTDLSETGRYAFAFAASIADHYGAKLTVFHVVDSSPELEKSLAGYISDDLWEKIKTRNLKEARDMLFRRKRDDTAIINELNQFVKDAQASSEDKPYVTYDIVVKMGNPVEEIIKQANEGNYDLIVIGNHGYGSVNDAFMGGTVRRVLFLSKIPVMVVRLPEGKV
jgi:nucleotide-binding universal stress UspA family protein